MKEYEKLLKVIYSYLKQDVVISNEDIISLYDLYNILKYELTRLEQELDLLLNNIQYEKNISDKYMNEKVKLYRINIHTNDNISELSFSYLNKKTREFTFESIFKEVDNDNINNNLKDNKIISKYYNKIIDIFAIQELQYYCYKLDFFEVNEKLSNGFFNIDIRYNKNGLYNFDISLNKDNAYNKKISKILIDNKNEILKRMSVSIDSLDEKTRRIIKNNINSNGKKMVKKV